MNIGFKLALTSAILTIFFAITGLTGKTFIHNEAWIPFAWLTFIATAVGAILRVWQSKK